MRVSELMERNVKAINSAATIGEAVTTLADEHVSALPVLDGYGQMIGVVSTSDLMTAEAEAEGGGGPMLGALFERTSVREIMTPRPYTIDHAADVREAAQRMLYTEVHRLFVTDGDALVGVVSTTDIVRAVATGRL